MSQLASECSDSQTAFFRLSSRTACLVFCCWLLPVTLAHGWQTELAEAEYAQQQGRSYAALDILESLVAEYPEVGRIHLELAVVYLSIDDFSAALASVDQVLVQPDLPEPVAVNARLLRLSIQRQQRRTERPVDTLSLTAYSGVEPGQIFQLGTQALLSRRQYQGQFRWLDRPLRQYWHLSLDADQSWQPRMNTVRYRVQPMFSLMHRWAAFDTRLGAGADFTDQDSAPILSTQIGWRPLPEFRLYLDQRWRRGSRWLSRTTRAGVHWGFLGNWSVLGDWQHQQWSPLSEDDGLEVQTRSTLGVGVSYQAHWQTEASLRAPVAELQAVTLSHRLSLPLSPQRWFLDNRVELPVSSVGSGVVADEVRWRTGVRWQL